MRVFSRKLWTISAFQNDVISNKSCLLQRAHISYDVTPVKMAVNVYESSGTNHRTPPLVIMHGLFGSKQNWKGISKALESKTRRKIFCVDARNHGESPHVPEHDSGCMAADVALLMEEQNLNKIAVMGHSMGGRAMMHFALKYPSLVEKAIIVDISPVSMPKNFKHMEDIFLAMKKAKVPTGTPMPEGRTLAERQMKKVVKEKATVDFIMMNLKRSESGEFSWIPNVDALHANFEHLRNAQVDMPPFHGPVLFIAGKQSDFVDPADWPKIQKFFPQSELKWLDCGHLVHFEQQAKFISLVTKFLNS